MKLAISPLTNEVFIVDNKGLKKDEVTQSFYQVMLLYLNDHNLIPVGDSKTKNLLVDGKPHWEITVKRLEDAAAATAHIDAK